MYGIKEVPFEPDHKLLFSIEVESLKMQIIADVGGGNAPVSNLNPGIRFSVAPDGKSMIYSTFREKSNLWMLEGFAGQ